MSVETFAAIDVGSYELSMKIFEFTSKKKMKEIDHVRHRIELGTDTYNTGKLRMELVDELCQILTEYSQIMKAYHVVAYKAYGTSAIREMKNRIIVLDQIRQRTGIQIDVLSNSEQRFLDYKSVASKGERFNHIIADKTAILDIGGGSIQVSLFDNDSLVTTQNLKLGILRIRERLMKLQLRPVAYEDIINEIIGSQVEALEKLYVGDRRIENIVVVDEYLSNALGNKKDMELDISQETYEKFMEQLKNKSTLEKAQLFQMPEESMLLLFISALLVKYLMDAFGTDHLWIPGVTLCDGIAYEYAEKNHVITTNHDFEKDIIGCTKNISRRYMGSKKREETLEMIAVTVFDSMKKLHGMGKRERLLLRLAALLHDCGKYITMMNVGEASYEIIMSTEIIGLSHMEREIVANVVRYNYREYDYYEAQSRESVLDRKSYLIITKLTAFLRLAIGLDRSHKEKFKNIVAVLKEKQLILTIDSASDITLEKGLFPTKIDLFEEVFNITPVIKQKRPL